MSDYTNDIEKYLNGELTPAERHALEKKALSDSFLADALEGAEQLHGDDFSKDVQELNTKLRDRRRTRSWIWPLRIAAGVALLLTSTYLVWLAVDTQGESDQLAHEKNNTPSEQPTAADSAAATGSPSSPPETAGPTETSQGKTQEVPSPLLKKTETQSLATQPETKAVEVVPQPEIAVAAETRAEDLKVEEAVALKQEKEADAVKDKGEETQRAQKLALDRDDQKKEPAPAAQERRAAGISPMEFTVTGKVTSAEDGSALPGINVVVKGTTTGTVTDEAGHYQVTVHDPQTVLMFSFIGLQTKEVPINERKTLDVSLSQDVTQLSEVVVTGYGISSEPAAEPTVDLAHPVGGFRDFKQYLQQNVRYPQAARANKVEGRVTIEFTVETDGSLANFIVVRGIGSGCDEELIRLVQEGPAWVPTKRDGVPVKDKARVRLKFDLPK